MRDGRVAENFDCGTDMVTQKEENDDHRTNCKFRPMFLKSDGGFAVVWRRRGIFPVRFSVISGQVLHLLSVLLDVLIDALGKATNNRSSVFNISILTRKDEICGIFLKRIIDVIDDIRNKGAVAEGEVGAPKGD